MDKEASNKSKTDSGLIESSDAAVRPTVEDVKHAIESLDRHERYWLGLFINEGLAINKISEKANLPVSRIVVIRERLFAKLVRLVNTYKTSRQRTQEKVKSTYPLRGTLLFYNDPTAPVGEDDWNAMK